MGMVYTPARAARLDSDSRKPSFSPGEGQQQGGQDGDKKTFVRVVLGSLRHINQYKSKKNPI